MNFGNALRGRVVRCATLLGVALMSLSVGPQASKAASPIRLNGPLVAGGNVSLYGLHFSPDSSRVVYHADQNMDEVFEIFSVPSIGGAAVRLNNGLVAGGDVMEFDPQFNPDSSRVLYRADQTTDDVYEIFSVPSSGGAAMKLNGGLVAGGDVLEYGLQFSPDSSRVVYLSDQRANDVYEIFSVPSSGGAAVKLNGGLTANGDVFFGGPQFSPDSGRVLYIADQTTDEVFELFSVPSNGGAAVKLNGPLVEGGDVTFSNLQFSPDGSRVLYLADQTTHNVFEIFSVPSTGGEGVKLSGAMGAGGFIQETGLHFSPDGSHVVYVARQTRDNAFELFSVPSTGGEAVKLNGALVAGGEVFAGDMRFSADGSRVLYHADQTTNGVVEIFIVPSTGGTAVKVSGSLVPGSQIRLSQFSPDGSLVLYHADQNADEVFEIFVRAVRARFVAADGSWDTAANWEQGVVPDEVMQVIIDRPAVVTATGGMTRRVVNELRLGGGSGASVLELRSDAVVSALNGFSILAGGGYAAMVCLMLAARQSPTSMAANSASMRASGCD